MTQTFFVSAPKGIHEILLEELQALNLPNPRQTRAGVEFEGTLKDAYRVCLHSRMATRVLMPMAEFPAASPEELYKGVQAIDWSDHLSPTHTLAIDANLLSSKITHSHFASLKVKDAIVDQFRERTRLRPTVDTERPDIRLNLWLHEDKATLSLDLSGNPLHMRGYRKRQGLAPIKENLAAALLWKAKWPEMAKAGAAFVDPFCGSGTIAIEALLMALDIAPGLYRKFYGFTHWRKHDEAAWNELRAEAEAARDKALDQNPLIYGFDRDWKACEMAKQALKGIGLQGRIHFSAIPLEEIICPTKKAGLLLTNPPYGQRMGSKADVRTTYRVLGEKLKQHYMGWKFAMILSEPEWAKTMGLRAFKKNQFFNGKIECELLQFEINEASVVNAPPKDPDRPWLGKIPGEEVQALKNRILKNAKKLKTWVNQNHIDCYRIYDKDLPEYALAIDLYHDFAHVAEYQAPKEIPEEVAEARLHEAMAILPEVLGIDQEHISLKQRRRQKGNEQYERQDERGDLLIVKENGLRFYVNIWDYLDTGLFLDHREVRQLIREKAQNKSFLNLFCYTASATTYAAAGGAKSSLSLDLSSTYLEWGEENLEINNLNDEVHRFEKADCLQWLEHSKEKFDLILLDPPSFSNSKKMQDHLDIQQDHVKLIRQAMARLKTGGELIFSCNLRGFKMDYDSLQDLQIEDITERTMPPDFERNSKIHQAFIIQKA